MSSPLSLAALGIGAACLVLSTLQRRAPHTLPIVTLIKEGFQFKGLTSLVLFLGFVAGSVQVLLPLAWAAARHEVDVAAPASFSLAYAGLVAATLAVKFLLAGAEEVIFRQSVMEQVSRKGGIAAAIAVSAALFGLAHMGRSGVDAPNILSLAVFVLDGAAFAVTYIATRSLWLPTIWHFTKNAWVWALYGGYGLSFAPGTFVVKPRSGVLSKQAEITDVVVTVVLVLITALLSRPLKALRQGVGT